MNWQKILRLAKQGHPLAISMLVNQAFPFAETTSKAAWRKGHLELWLEAQHSPPPQAPCIAYLQTGFQNLAAPSIKQVQVFCCLANQAEVIWHEVIHLPTNLNSQPIQPQQACINAGNVPVRSMPARPYTKTAIAMPASALALAYGDAPPLTETLPAPLTDATAGRKLNSYLYLIKYLLNHRYLKYVFIILLASISSGILWTNLQEIQQATTRDSDLTTGTTQFTSANLWLPSVMYLGDQITSTTIQDIVEQQLEDIRRTTEIQDNNTIPSNFAGKIVNRVPLRTQQKVIALTFDDGPWPNATPQILEILEQQQIRGTFFLLGQTVKAYPDLAQAIVAAGHTIGNHSWSHPYQAMNPTTAASQIKRTTEIIQDTTGAKATLFRPPGGYMNNGLVTYAQQNDYAIVMWSADSLDYTQPSVSRLLNNVLSQASSGGIVLMHDGGGNRAQTVAALPLLIRELKQRGYQFVTIPELFHLYNQEQILGQHVWLGIQSLDELYALRQTIQSKLKQQVGVEIKNLVFAQNQGSCYPISSCLFALATVEKRIYVEEQARQYWHQAVNLAMAAAELAHVQQPTSQTWEQSELKWQNAIALLKQIPVDSIWRLRAQQKILEYSKNHAVAKYQLEASQSQFIKNILASRNLSPRTYLSICNLQGKCRQHNGHLAITDPASLIKVPIALALVHKIKTEKLSWDTTIKVQSGNYTEDFGSIIPGKRYSLQALMTEMINHSSNIATNQLIDYLGRDAINQFLQTQGYRYSRVHSKLIGQVTAPKNLGNQSNSLSTTELSQMMLGIYRSQDLDLKHVNQALQQQFDHEIGFKALSNQPAKWLGEKTGQTSRTLGTTLAFQLRDQTYILTLVDQSGQGERQLRQIIQDVVKYLTQHPF